MKEGKDESSCEMDIGEDQMNHPLAIYTALYFAILFLTVSIWSGDIRSARGESLALLVLVGTFSLKLAIDDYIHFHKPVADKKRLHLDLWFSLLVYLLLAATIAAAARTQVRAAEILMALVMLLGLVWLIINYATGTAADKKRRLQWAGINLVFILFLLADVFFVSKYCPEGSLWIIYGLVALVVLDACWLGTLKRLAELE